MEEKQAQANSQFKLQAFGKDVLVYAAGNVLLLLFSFIGLFIIPKHLTVEGYGYWQLFLLYISYVGILHLGFNDGILVRWAGKELAQIGNEMRTAFRFLIFEQVLVIVPLSLLFYFLIQPPLKWICLMVLAFAFIRELENLFIFAAQAVRRFRELTILNVCTAFVFLLLIIALLATGHLDYHYVVFAYLASLLLLLITLGLRFSKYVRGEKLVTARLWAYGKENISIGIFILLGNFVLVLFLTIDRLMVSSFFPIGQFAIYALACAIIAMVYSFVKATSDVLFPYISATAHQLRSQAYHLGKSAIILLWAAILSMFFSGAKVIEFYLPQYAASLPIVQILVCSVGFGSLIQILHLNYYKVYRKQRQYFFWGLAALALSIVLSVLAIKVWGTLESVAIAILISFGLWYIVNEFALRQVIEGSSREPWRNVTILLCYIGVFWLASFAGDWFVTKTLIYLGLFSLVTWLFLRHEVNRLVVVARELMKRHQ